MEKNELERRVLEIKKYPKDDRIPEFREAVSGLFRDLTDNVLGDIKFRGNKDIYSHPDLCQFGCLPNRVIPYLLHFLGIDRYENSFRQLNEIGGFGLSVGYEINSVISYTRVLDADLFESYSESERIDILRQQNPRLISSIGDLIHYGQSFVLALAKGSHDCEYNGIGKNLFDVGDDEVNSKIINLKQEAGTVFCEWKNTQEQFKKNPEYYEYVKACNLDKMIKWADTNYPEEINKLTTTGLRITREIAETLANYMISKYEANKNK